MTVVYDGTDECTERSIQPIGLYSWNGFWYCPAYCFKGRRSDCSAPTASSVRKSGQRAGPPASLSISSQLDQTFGERVP
ncbi:hypothetical protein PO124_28620 [Bacillus licheniformis]|nr:hypothetical protein [Bacillus licheniformis]